MIAVIAAREIRDHLRSFRYQALCGLLLLLMPLGAWTSARRYHDRLDVASALMKEREKAVAGDQRIGAWGWRTNTIDEGLRVIRRRPGRGGRGPRGPTRFSRATSRAVARHVPPPLQRHPHNVSATPSERKAEIAAFHRLAAVEAAGWTLRRADGRTYRVGWTGVAGGASVALSQCSAIFPSRILYVSNDQASYILPGVSGSDTERLNMKVTKSPSAVTRSGIRGGPAGPRPWP